MLSKLKMVQAINVLLLVHRANILNIQVKLVFTRHFELHGTSDYRDSTVFESLYFQNFHTSKPLLNKELHSLEIQIWKVLLYFVKLI